MARLHEVLQISFGWDDEHLNRFEILGREYDGGMIGINTRALRLCDLKLRRLGVPSFLLPKVTVGTPRISRCFSTHKA